MRHLPRIHQLEAIASCRLPNQPVHSPLRLSQTRGIRRRNPDDFLNRATASFADKAVKIVAHLCIRERAIHPIRSELDDDDRRLVFVQFRQLRRERGSRRPPIHEITEHVRVDGVLAITALGDETRLPTQPMLWRRAAGGIRGHGIFLGKMPLHNFAEFPNGQ